MKFSTVYNLQEVGEFDSFEEAFASLYRHVDAARTGEGLSLQMLETACWIKSSGSLPFMFFDAVTMAHESGLLIDGKPSPKLQSLINKAEESVPA